MDGEWLEGQVDSSGVEREGGDMSSCVSVSECVRREHSLNKF